MHLPAPNVRFRHLPDKPKAVLPARIAGCELFHDRMFHLGMGEWVNNDPLEGTQTRQLYEQYYFKTLCGIPEKMYTSLNVQVTTYKAKRHQIQLVYINCVVKNKSKSG